MPKNVPTNDPEYSLWWGYIDETYSPEVLPDLMKKALEKRWFWILQYNDSFGLPDLRDRVSLFVREKYAISATSGEIIITNWSTASIDLIGRTILQWKYDSVVLEPIYDTALASLKLNSRALHTIPYSFEDGTFSFAKLEEILSHPDVRLMYVNPNFHNPTGSTLSQGQKTQILDLCFKYGVQIIEDDPYALYDFSGQNPDLAKDSMRNLDSVGNTVIYLNSFSKIFFPGIRLGYMIWPQKILEMVSHIQKYSTSSANLLMQWLIIEGLESHLVHSAADHYKSVLAHKYEQTQQALTREWMRDVIDFTQWRWGFFIWWRIKNGVKINTDDLLPVTQAHGTTFIPWSKYFVKTDTRHLRLSYWQIHSERVDEAISRFAKSVKLFLD